ncbi:hypothetical protein M758_8G021400 [Ceratodon purpureus]|nr:hypothetical protein M758_8G021400 [Ceratodon purpureus]
MANVIRRVVAQRSGVNWSGEEGLGSGISNVTRRLISSQPQAIDVHREGGEVVASVAGAALPWAWSHEAVRGVSQLVAPKGKRLFLVDTLALVRRLESEGLTPKQSEAITAVITEVLNDSLENVGQTFTSIHEMQRSEMMADAALGKFKGQMQSSQDHHFAMLQQETERLRTDIDKMRNESKYAIDKVTSGQRLDLNLERGRIRDELSTQSAETSNLTNKLDREIHSLKTQLEAAKFDVIKYCIGTIASVTAVGLGMLRLIM